MQYEQAYSFLISKLEDGLPAYITYHDAQHTKNVISAAEHLAELEEVTGDNLILLKTAALFHDAGFIQHHQDHEEISCKIARKYLPGYKYTEEQIDIICRLIMTTKLPQSPFDHLSQLLCDADLYYLGGDEYTKGAEKLFLEYKRNGLVETHAEWQLKQLEFLSTHRYYTKSAIYERETGKQRHWQELRSKIESSIMHNKENPAHMIHDFILVITGVLFAGSALKYFLVPNNFFDGGITGLSLLVHELYHLNLGIVILLL